MGKEHVHTQVIPYCTVKDFFEILYADGAAAREFHRVADKDANAQVEEWVGNTRTVHFTMPMQLPAVIAKLIGSNTIPVKEVQVAETASDGTLHIVSTPTIGVPGGSRFQAVARLTVSSTVTCRGSFGCKVVAQVTCTADGPWGLQGMIEGIMIDQSAATVQVYLDFCRARCQAVCSKQVVDGLGSPRSDTSGVEQFFDAQEILSRQLSGVSNSGLSLGPSTAEIIDTVALLRLLDTLDGRLMLLSLDVAEMRALIPPDMPPSSTPPARRDLGHRFGSWLMGFACGAAVVSAIAFIIRHRHAGTRF